MALPHPHGSGVGQIAENAYYDTGNTPGSTGGRFVGFGEEGTSPIANRAHWALSENIQYVYERLAKEFAAPQMVYWVPAGGGGDHYDFSGDDVWCGDAPYLPWAQLKMDSLFTILDEHYNQLIDPTTQGKVVGKSIYDGGDDAYGTGFVTDPILRFQVVDPTNPDGAPLVSPYTIPDGTKVYILHGRKTALEDLATDVFANVPIRVGEELPAGVIFQNGTRPMIGNLNINGHTVDNVETLRSSDSEDLNFQGQSGAENLWINQWFDIELSSANLLTLTGELEAQVRGGDISFQDTRLGTPLYLTRTGTTTVQGKYADNLVEHINSRWYNDAALHGNRVRSVTGSFSYNDTTRQVDWPALDVILNGDRVSVAAGNVIAPNGTAQVLVVQSSGVVTQKAAASVLATDLPVAYYYYTGGAFTIKYDARWLLSRRTAALDIIVGCDSAYNILPGADFATLASAMTCVKTLKIISAALGKSSLACTIHVRGTVYVPAEVAINVDGLRIVGDGDAKIIATHGASENTLDAAGAKHIELRNLIFKWGTATLHNTAYGCIANLGDVSKASQLVFQCDAGSGESFASAFIWETGMSGDMVHIQDCYGDVAAAFVSGGSTSGLFRSVVDHCFAKNSTSSISAGYAFDARYGFNSFINCKVYSSGSGSFDGGVRVGYGGIVKNCDIEVLDLCGIAIEPLGSSGSTSQISVKDNRVVGGQKGIKCDIPSGHSTVTYQVYINGNHVSGAIRGIACDNNPGEVGPASTIFIESNVVSEVVSNDGCAGIYVQYMPHAHITANTVDAYPGVGIRIESEVRASIKYNRVTGYSDAGLVPVDQGTGDSIATVANGLTALTDTGFVFAFLSVGDYIQISGATSPGNNGCFPIMAVPGLSGNVVRYYNPAAVTEAFAGTWKIWNGEASAICVQSVAQYGCEIEGNYATADKVESTALWAPVISCHVPGSRIVGNYVNAYSATADDYALTVLGCAYAQNLCISGNFFEAPTYWDILLTHPAASTGVVFNGEIAITGNYIIGPVNSRGAAIRSCSVGGLSITGNVIRNGYCGVDLLTFSGQVAPNAITIVGNVFDEVGIGGTDTTYPSVIYLDGTLLPHDTTISENVFRECGASDGTVSTSCLLYINRTDVAVTGNSFYDPKSGTDATLSYVIYTYCGGCSIVGNTFFASITSNFAPSVAGAVVYVYGSYTTVSDNVFMIVGNMGAGSFYGIRVTSTAENCACAGNVFSSFQSAGTYKWAIYGDGTHCTFIGNTGAAWMEFPTPSGYHNMVIGNIASGTGVQVLVGVDNFTSGNHDDTP